MKYCNRSEREAYAVTVDEAGMMFYTASKQVVSNEEKVMFVIGPDETLYVAEKVWGTFHHTSFLGGSVVLGAGSMMVTGGKLNLVNPHSGHYLPSPENFARCCAILESKGIRMDGVERGNIKVRVNLY